MKSLEEVFEGIEAFKEDMEKLGVLVEVSVHSAPAGVDHEVAINLRTLVREDLEEDIDPAKKKYTEENMVVEEAPLVDVDERTFSEVLAKLRDVRKWATTNQGDPWAFRQAMIVVMAIDTNVALESGVDAEGLDEFDMVSRALAIKILEELKING